MREGNFNRVERAERVENGLGVSSHAKSAKFAKSDVGNVFTQRHKGTESWPMVRLGDVCEFRRGLTYAKADEVAYSSKVVLRSNNVDLESSELNLNDLKYLREDFEVPAEKIIEPNTLLMCMANGSKSHLGKVALIEQDFKYAFGGFMGLLVPRNINSKYLYYFLSAPLFKAYVKSLQDGANINNLKFSDFSEFQIPLPPIEVQKEIVERLEKELGEADKVAAEFKRMVELADKEFKAELDEVFSALGGGCEEGEDFAHAKSAKSDVGNVFTQRHKGTESWPMVRLGDVAEIKYGYTAKKVVEKENDYPCYLRITDIQDGEVDWKSVPYCQCDDIEAYRLIEGDIVFARTGATTGKSFLLRGDFPLSVFASYLIRVRIEDWKDLYSIYLKYYFDTSEYWDKIKVGIAGAAQGGFNSKKLAEIQFPLPPIEVQKEIVAKLDAAKERCEKLKAEAERGLRAAENLRKAILSEAFE